MELHFEHYYTESFVISHILIPGTVVAPRRRLFKSRFFDPNSPNLHNHVRTSRGKAGSSAVRSFEQTRSSWVAVDRLNDDDDAGLEVGRRGLKPVSQSVVSFLVGYRCFWWLFISLLFSVLLCAIETLSSLNTLQVRCVAFLRARVFFARSAEEVQRIVQRPIRPKPVRLSKSWCVCSFFMILCFHVPRCSYVLCMYLFVVRSLSRLMIACFFAVAVCVVVMFLRSMGSVAGNI